MVQRFAIHLSVYNENWPLASHDFALSHAVVTRWLGTVERATVFEGSLEVLAVPWACWPGSVTFSDQLFLTG